MNKKQQDNSKAKRKKKQKSKKNKRKNQNSKLKRKKNKGKNSKNRKNHGKKRNKGRKANRKDRKNIKKKKKLSKKQKKIRRQRKRKQRKQTRQSSCTSSQANYTCMAAALKGLLFEQQQITNYLKQSKTLERHQSVSGNKQGKKNTFEEAEQHLLWAIGGDIDNPICGPNDTSTSKYNRCFNI